MYINKVNNTSFKGYYHSVNNAGEHVHNFVYPYDKNSRDAKIEFYSAFAQDGDKPVKVINLKDANNINFDEIPELKDTRIVPYRVVIDGKHVVDSGYYTADRTSARGFNLINRDVTTPLNQGQAIFTILDIHRPGAYYEDFASPHTGKVVYDIQRQKDSERIIRTFSNSGGGSLAGIQYDIENKIIQYGKLILPPIFGYDNKSAPRYWNKNDMQIADEIASIENYETFIRSLYKNGMQYVDDFAVTSEGLEGIHVQYALRWADQNPQTRYWFRMNGLEHGPITLGVVPINKQEHLRCRFVNLDEVFNESTLKWEPNPYYNPNAETHYNIYDYTQVTKEQLANLNEPIMRYKNTYSDNKLSINNYGDTLIPYSFEVRPEEIKSRVNEYVKMKKRANEPIDLNTPEAALFIGQFKNFKIGTDAEGAVFWDANKDIFKRNYYISGYDEKLLNAIADPSQRAYMREMLYRANCEVQDMAIQAGVYRTQLVKDTQILYTAQMLRGASTKAEINKLIGKFLPKGAELSEDAIANIKDGWYNLERKGLLSREDITIKALMKLPLDALEFGENTVGVLSTSYFTNRAADNESIGLSRFDYYKNNLEVCSPYSNVYYNVDNLYESKLKNFADEVISNLNKISPEKLLDSKGNYTEYGEYVMDLLGKDIAKYALLKAVAGNNLQAKIMSDDVYKGKMTYNYRILRETTTLKALGINASSPEEEAKALYRIIADGLSNLDKKDVDFVVKSLSKQLEGTSTESFRIAEAMVDKAGLGLDFRLDAAKDIVDMDAVRNGDMSFDQAWDQVIDFWKKYVKVVKKINPDAYIMAEITDLEQLLRCIYGGNADVYGMDLSKAGSKHKNVQDAMNAFFRETGITSEAGYSYTFTDALRLLSADGEVGNISKNGISSLENRIQALINTNSLDYIVNLSTFADNHDKPSVIHIMALDMELFHTSDLMPQFRENAEKFNGEYYEMRRRNARIAVMQELANADKFEDLPLEAMMNIDNGSYFRTANTRSTAMSRLIREAINERIPNSFAKKDLLKQALVDLTNGSYLENSGNINLQTITLPGLRTLEEALDEILAKAGIVLTSAQKRAIIEKAKQRTMIEKYAVRGDFDWDGGKHWTAVELQNRAKTVLANGEYDFMKYSPYTVSVAALLTESYKEVVGEKDITSFTNGTRDFVHKYNRRVVEDSRTALPFVIDSEIVQKQNAYAARDIETVIDMMIQQAENKSGRKFTETERNYIMKEVFAAATEPAVQKALMYASFLSALPGIPMVNYRDIFGDSGYEEKAKNVYLQNRNTIKHSEKEQNGPLKEYRTKIFNEFTKVMNIRNTEGLEALNGGTPYMLKTNNPDTMAMLYEKGDSVAITILNAGGIDPHNRVEYKNDSKNPVYSINVNNSYVPIQSQIELDSIILPDYLSLTEGMVFVSAIDGDRTEYVVKKAKNGVYYLARKDGRKIVLNGNTARFGTMFLKAVRRPVFRGRNINQRYNIASNPYQIKEQNERGKTLSVISG